jgi:hypothetical protein
MANNNIHIPYLAGILFTQSIGILLGESLYQIG